MPAASPFAPPERPLFESVEFYLGDPQPAYRALRQHAPVYWHELRDGSGMWMLSRWEDIRFVSKKPELFTTSRGVLLNDRLPESTAVAETRPRAEGTGLEPAAPCGVPQFQ